MRRYQTGTITEKQGERWRKKAKVAAPKGVSFNNLHESGKSLAFPAERFYLDGQ
jgi:hypothetical protein